MAGRVIVTGASGFVGVHVVTALAARGAPVLAVARGPLRGLPAGISAHRIEEYGCTPIGHDDVIVHLAETATVGNACGDDSVRLVRTLLARRPRRFVYLSSALVYGDKSAKPHRRDDPLAPTTDYARAKINAEKEILAAGGVVLRASNLYGRGMAKNTVFSEIIRQLGGTGPVTLRSLAPRRDYLWVKDAADGLARAALGAPIGVYNLGTNIGTSVEQLSRRILSLAGEDKRAVREMVKSEFSMLVVDCDSTFDAFDWRPATKLEDGLRRLLERWHGA